MKTILYISFCFGIIFQTFAQTTEQPEKLFSVAMRTHFKKYAKEVDRAYFFNKYQKADSIFNHFITSKLVNTKFSNYRAKKLVVSSIVCLPHLDL